MAKYPTFIVPSISIVDMKLKDTVDEWQESRHMLYRYV